MALRNLLLGGLFGLFLLLFIAIIVEELFLGGRQRRRLERARKEGKHADHAGR